MEDYGGRRPRDPIKERERFNLKPLTGTRKGGMAHRNDVLGCVLLSCAAFTPRLPLPDPEELFSGEMASRLDRWEDVSKIILSFVGVPSRNRR